MIKELMNFREVLPQWNVPIRSTPHPALKQFTRKGTKVYLAQVGKDGIAVSEADLSELCEWRTDNHNRMVIALNKTDDRDKKLREQVSARFKNLEKLLKLVGEAGLLSLLGQLFRTLTALGADTVSDLLIQNKQVQADCVIAFEVDNPIPFGIWSNNFTAALSDRLYAVNNMASAASTEKDVFGNSASGAKESVGLMQTPAGIKIRVYSRNDDNENYSRYGMNGNATCKIGSDSRRMLKEVLETVVRPELQAKMLPKTEGGGFQDRPGLWYREGDSLVLSCIAPLPVMELGYDEETAKEPEKRLTEKMWRAAATEVASMLRAKQVAAPNVHGQILVLRQPPGNNGSWRVIQSRSVTPALVADKLEAWQAGLDNGPTDPLFYDYVDLRRAMKALNLEFSMRGKVIAVRKPKGKKSDSSNAFNIAEMYDLFFDQPQAITKVSAHLADYVVPWMLRLHGAETDTAAFYAFKQLYPLCNLTLLKLGFPVEKSMNTWAHRLGRILKIADDIQYFYYRDRGRQTPAIRVGQKFVKAIYVNPKAGFEQFLVEVNPFLDWAKAPGKGGRNSWHNWDEFNKLVQSLPDELPSRPVGSDRLQLAKGYGLPRTSKKIAPETAPEITPVTG